MKSRTKIPKLKIEIEMIQELGLEKFFIVYLQQGSSQKVMEFPVTTEGTEEIIKIIRNELIK